MERPPSFTVGRVKLKVTRLPNATDSRCNGYRNPMAFLTETETPALNSYGTARPHTCTRPGGTSKVGTCTYCFPNLLQDCRQWGSRWTRAAGSTLIAWLVPGPCPTNLGLRAHTRRGGSHQFLLVPLPLPPLVRVCTALPRPRSPLHVLVSLLCQPRV